MESNENTLTAATESEPTLPQDSFPDDSAPSDIEESRPEEPMKETADEDALSEEMTDDFSERDLPLEEMDDDFSERDLPLEEMDDDFPEKDLPKNSRAVRKANRKKGGKVSLALKCIGVFLLATVLLAGGYFYYLLSRINYKEADAFDQYYDLSETGYVEQNETYETPRYYNESTTLEGFDPSMLDIPEEDVLNVMLIGTDLRSNSYKENGSTDSMILLSINTHDKNVKLTSFMRDMYVEIPERGSNRLNTAYSFGGPQLLFDTLKNNFNVNVSKYVRLNFANFRNVINEVGGIDIELTKAEADYMNKYSKKYHTKHVDPGWQRLDGAQALSYARCRKIDSDFKRTERQRKVINAFVKEVKQKNVVELNSLLNVMLPMIQTNMTKTEIVELLADAPSYMNGEIESLNVPIKNSYKPETIQGRSVICPNFELNNTAIQAHIYSSYQLDVSGTKFKDFETPQSDEEKALQNEAYGDDGTVYYNNDTAGSED